MNVRTAAVTSAYDVNPAWGQDGYPFMFYTPASGTFSSDSNFALTVDTGYYGMGTIYKTFLTAEPSISIENIANVYYPSDIVLHPDDSYALVIHDYCVVSKLMADYPYTLTNLAGLPDPDCSCTDGVGTLAQFDYPTGIAMHPSGDYALISENNYIRKILISTADVTTIVGHIGQSAADGIGTNAVFGTISGITIVGYNFAVVTDSMNQNLRKILLSTLEVTSLTQSGFGGHADGSLNTAEFYSPYGICSSKDGNIIAIADSGNFVLRKISPLLTSFQECMRGLIAQYSKTIEDLDTSLNLMMSLYDYNSESHDSAMYQLKEAKKSFHFINHHIDRCSEKCPAPTPAPSQAPTIGNPPIQFGSI